MDLIGLAIADETRVHHKRPDSLRALVPTYFQRLPVDPWHGSDFLYEPQGIPAQIFFDGGKFAPGTPFLASAGWLESRLVARPTSQNGKASFEVVNRFGPAQNADVPGSPLSISGPAVRLP
jgi:hypothetical protein